MSWVTFRQSIIGDIFESSLKGHYQKTNKSKEGDLKMTMLRGFFKKEEGVTAIEYGLIAFLIAMVCVITWTAVGNQLVAIFGQIVTALGG